MANKDPLLTFQRFQDEKNNFVLHFVGNPGENMAGDAYRRNECYKRCMEALPDEFGKLAAELRQSRDWRSPEFMQKLYLAYKTMHPFAESNWEMFE